MKKMSENIDALKKALAENSRFKAEKAELLKKQSADEFSGKLKLSERIMWAYLLVCIVFAVPVLNIFILSGDLKTLIVCLLVLVVVYETTVLLKLWYVVVSTKISILKDIKLLRLEISQLSLAATPTESTVLDEKKYEPARALSKTERRLWLAAVALTAIILGSLSGGGFAWFSGESNKVDNDTIITLNADGSAVSTTDIAQRGLGITAPIASTFSPASFNFYSPPERKITWFDSQGQKLSYTTKPQGSHTCYKVKCPQRNSSDRCIAYTYISEIPNAAKLTGNVWTYANDICYGGKQNRFTTTVFLPEKAELVSAEPRPALEFTSNGRRAIRFQGVRGQNEKFAYKLQYRLIAETDHQRSTATKQANE